MDTAHRIDISILNDTYGELLTKHQTEMIRLYYDLDVSLNEIAEQYSISRQAVRDAIMRGEKALLEFESKLHFVDSMSKLQSGLSKIKSMTTDRDVLSEVDALIDIVEGD